MAEYYYKTNGEEVKCVNCVNKHFLKRPQGNDLVAYECASCHFVTWFPVGFAPEEKIEKSL